VPPLVYHYQYRNTSGPDWIEGRNWSTDPSWTWAGYAGTFEIKGRVRNSGNPATDGERSISMLWSPTPTCQVSAARRESAPRNSHSVCR
jgi:hypothetical protein